MSIYFQIEEYHRPQDLTQAIDILSRFGNSARVIAGGTDILLLLNTSTAKIKVFLATGSLTI